MSEHTQPAAPQSSLSVPMAIIIAGLAIAAAIYFSGVPNRGSVPQAITQKTLPTPISNKDHIIGNPNAKVIVVEYSDTECPFCKVFHDTMNRIMAEYGKDGNVAWVYRHFPIAGLHPRAAHEAEATECVNKIGGNEKFWEYLNKIFATTLSNNKLDPSELPKMAREIGIDDAAFTACLDGGEMKALIDASIADGVKSGVQGTPRSLIVVNKKVVDTIDGALPYEVVKAQIDAVLK